jgi:hypothetical protein
VGVAGLLELLDDAIALGGRRVDGHQVVVVQVHAPGADIGQQLHGVDRRQDGTDFGAERIAAAVGDGPQAEGELCSGRGTYWSGLIESSLDGRTKVRPYVLLMAELKLGPTLRQIDFNAG